MPYPDNYNYTERDEYEICPDAMRDIDRCHALWVDMLESYTAGAIKRGMWLSLEDFGIAMEGISESLADYARSAIYELDEKHIHWVSCTPDNSKAAIARAYDRLIESLKPQPIDWSAAIGDAMKAAASAPAKDFIEAASSRGNV